MNKKKIVSLILVSLLILGGFVGVLWQQGIIGRGDRALYNKIKDRRNLVEVLERAQDLENKIKTTPEKVGLYLQLGLEWKTLGDLSGEPGFYKKALTVYETGITKFGSKNILFYLNAGKTAELLEDYTVAEKYYQQAIAVSPGDENGYLNLASLYDYKLHKSKEAVVAVFNQGGQKLFNPIAIIAARASYLRRIGENSAALADYETLVKNFPDNQGFKNIVSELKEKIGTNK